MWTCSGTLVRQISRLGRLRGSTSCFARYVAFSGGSCFSKPRSISYVPQITISVDGHTYFTNNNPNTGDNGWPYDKNFYVILNLAIGGDWGGAQGVDPNTWPKQMLVDYVRVYQR